MTSPSDQTWMTSSSVPRSTRNRRDMVLWRGMDATSPAQMPMSIHSRYDDRNVNDAAIVTIVNAQKKPTPLAVEAGGGRSGASSTYNNIMPMAAVSMMEVNSPSLVAPVKNRAMTIAVGTSDKTVLRMIVFVRVDVSRVNSKKRDDVAKPTYEM